MVGVSRRHLLTSRLHKVAASFRLTRIVYNNHAPTTPTIASAPDPALTPAPVAVAAEAAALAALAPVPRVVVAEADAAAAAGRVGGCATPLGQCQ
jgi:hypothetical protein